MKVHFLARERHFFDHLAPVWLALGSVAADFWIAPDLADHARRRGVDRARVIPRAVARSSVWTPAVRASLSIYRRRRRILLVKRQRIVRQRQAIERGIEGMPAVSASAPMVVASASDLERVANRRRPLVLFEHGAGQSYGNRHPSFCGGVSAARAQVGLFVVPNVFAAQANLLAYPRSRVAIVGCPKLDQWHRAARRPRHRPPIVAISFHWHSHVVPETRGAFQYFRSGLPALAKRYRLLGHGHPRIIGRLAKEYRRLGIEVVRDFDEVLRRADVYAVDNSSTLFEFASTDRPVVVLNAPWFRRRVEHGLRFWRFADVGVACDHPRHLVAAVRRALADPREQQIKRQIAVNAIYPSRDGRAAQRAAAAIRGWWITLAGRQPR